MSTCAVYRAEGTGRDKERTEWQRRRIEDRPVDGKGEQRTSGWAFMIAILRVLCGSSVMSQRKSEGSCGGPANCFPSSFSVGEGTSVRRGERPSVRESAPPK